MATYCNREGMRSIEKELGELDMPLECISIECFLYELSFCLVQIVPESSVRYIPCGVDIFFNFNMFQFNFPSDTIHFTHYCYFDIK